MQNNKTTFEQLDIFNDYFKEIIEESMYTKLKEICDILDARGFNESRQGTKAHYVIERAFVEQ